VEDSTTLAATECGGPGATGPSREAEAREACRTDSRRPRGCPAFRLEPVAPRARRKERRCFREQFYRITRLPPYVFATVTDRFALVENEHRIRQAMRGIKTVLG
jgi:hypothetical protein